MAEFGLYSLEAILLMRELEARRKEELSILLDGRQMPVQVFKLGPNLPIDGVLEGTIPFSLVPESMKIGLLKNGQISSSAGSSPVSWSGTKWVLKR